MSHTSALSKRAGSKRSTRQKYGKHETHRILTQKYVKKKYGKKMQSSFTKYNKTLQNTYYKLIEQKG